MATLQITRPLTTAEVSEATGIPNATLRYWRHCGTGPRSYTLGTSVRYDAADVQGWLDQQKASTSRGGNAA